MQSQEIIMLVGFVLLMGGLMFYQQWQARRRREKQIAGLSLGDEIMTVGGLIGKLTQLDAEAGQARIEIAPGVEIRIMLVAISRPLNPPDAGE